MDGSEITSFNIAKNLTNLSLISPNENHFATPPQNQSPANEYRSDDCNEILAKELEQLNEVKMDDRSPDDSERATLVSQSSIEIEICDIDKRDELNSIEEEPESMGEVDCETQLDLISCMLNYESLIGILFDIPGVDHFGCSFRCSTVRYRLQYEDLREFSQKFMR